MRKDNLQKTVLVVFGTRPEAIKMAPVVKELGCHDAIRTVVCVTAQHRAMLDQVLEVFHINPDYDLNIMKPGQSLTSITTAVLNKMEKVLLKEKPDLVLVHGDTTTAMATALAAFYQQIPVGHVEAGLRTYNIDSPYPEEINRQIIDRIAQRLYAPTKINRNQLEKALNKGQEIIVTGNTVIDALKLTVNQDYQHEIFDWVGDNRMILVTTHRRENLGEPMRRIFAAINKVTMDFDDVRVVFPAHLNPCVRELATSVLADNPQVKIIDPLDTIDFHNFAKRAYMILTDSGGVQEEAPSLNTPVLVLRDTTERPEGVDAGTLKLVGTDTERVYNEVKKLLMDDKAHAAMAMTANPYGDGHASQYIAEDILKFLNQ